MADGRKVGAAGSRNAGNRDRRLPGVLQPERLGIGRIHERGRRPGVDDELVGLAVDDDRRDHERRSVALEHLQVDRGGAGAGV